MLNKILYYDYMGLSVGTKIILAVLVVILVFGTIASVGVGFFTQQTLIASRQNSLRDLSIAQAREMQILLNHSQQYVAAIAQDPFVQRYLQLHAATDRSEEEQEEYQELARLLLDDFNRYNIRDEFDSIYLMDRLGMTLVSTDPRFVGENFSFRQYFQSARDGQPFVDVAIGSISKQPGYYASHPVLNDLKTSVQGVITVKLAPEKIHTVLTGVQNEEVYDDLYSSTHDGMVVDANGVIVYTNEPEKLYRSLVPLDQATQQRIDENRTYPDITIEPLAYEELYEKINEYETPVFVTLYDEFEESEEIHSLVQIGQLPFFLILSDDIQEINAASFQASALISIFVGIAAISSSAIVWLFVSVLLRPIQELETFSQAISEGDYSKKISVDTGDEFYQLSKVMTSMAQKIKKSQQNLERQVEKKTEELHEKVVDLEKMNTIMVGRELKMAELKKKIKELQEKQ